MVHTEGPARNESRQHSRGARRTVRGAIRSVSNNYVPLRRSNNNSTQFFFLQGHFSQNKKYDRKRQKKKLFGELFISLFCHTKIRRKQVFFLPQYLCSIILLPP